MCPGRDSNPYALRPRGLSLPNPCTLAFTVVRLTPAVRLVFFAGRLRIGANCNYDCNYTGPLAPALQ